MDAEDFLSCSLCLGDFTDPRALPCLHTFCFDCLDLYANTASGNRLKCPICREEHQIPSNGVDGFRQDFRMKSFLESRRPLKDVSLNSVHQPPAMSNGSDVRPHKKVTKNADVGAFPVGFVPVEAQEITTWQVEEVWIKGLACYSRNEVTMIVPHSGVRLYPLRTGHPYYWGCMGSAEGIASFRGRNLAIVDTNEVILVKDLPLYCSQRLK